MLVPLEPPRRDVSFADNPRNGWFNLSSKYAIEKFLRNALINIGEKEYWLKQYASKNPADSADVRDYLAGMTNIKRKVEQLIKESNALEREIGDWSNEGFKGL